MKMKINKKIDSDKEIEKLAEEVRNDIYIIANYSCNRSRAENE